VQRLPVAEELARAGEPLAQSLEVRHLPEVLPVNLLDEDTRHARLGPLGLHGERRAQLVAALDFALLHHSAGLGLLAGEDLLYQLGAKDHGAILSGGFEK
jgi:hypothetical protein